MSAHSSTEPMLSALLSAPGAVAGAGVDAGVAAHYGDPMREQRLLAEATGTSSTTPQPTHTRWM